jgi:hypothetical protein
VVIRQLELDEESNPILSALAEDYEGNAGRALSHLLHAHEGSQSLAAESEQLPAEQLLSGAGQAFREGRTVNRDDV